MDPDGCNIKNLLFACFWYLCPELVINGHIYVANPPLFRITTKKNEYIYLKGQRELDEYKLQHQNEKFLINRNKGLSEQNPQELGFCLLEPETRDVEQILVNNKEEAEKLLDIFMGTDTSLRKEYILLHSEEARN